MKAIVLLFLLSLTAILQAQPAKKAGGTPVQRDSASIADSIKRVGMVKKDSLKKDSLIKKPLFNLKRNEFNFILQRSFIAGAGGIDSTSISTLGSGTTTFGLGYAFNISKKFALQLQPQLSFFRLSYNQVEGKVFPTVKNTALSKEKHRITYAELPISVQYTLKRDEKKNKATYAELGGYVGLQIGSLYKIAYEETDSIYNISHNIVKKESGIPYTNPLRYGVYGRVGQGFLSLFVNYRISSVFTNTRKVSNGSGGVIDKYNSRIPALEFGISFVL